MPELPEVETVRLQLARKIVGKTIRSATVFHPKTVAFDPIFEKRLSGKTVSAIDRVGKLLIWGFQEDPHLFLLAHLKMTGQFFYVENGRTVTGGGHTYSSSKLTDTFPHRHTRTAFHFTDGSSLYFNDMRLFGYTKLADPGEAAHARSGYGPEYIDPNFDVRWFTTAVQKRSAPIKAILLDQALAAGLGNIYVDETLWRAKVHPVRLGKDVTNAEAKNLARYAKSVMLDSIEVGGTTFQNFTDTGGKHGNYSDHLKVFGKTGEPCPRCKTPIEKIRVAGRGTHVCPHCQR